MTNWEDRIVDTALQEINGQQPPDLSARVVLALQEQGGGDLGRGDLGRRDLGLGDLGRGDLGRGTLPRLTPPRQVTVTTFLLAAAAMFLITLTVAFFATDDRHRLDRATTSVQIDVDVLAGAIECVTMGSEQTSVTITAGDRAWFTPRTGDRLRAAMQSKVRLAGFPTLTTGPTTELEVQTMEFSMNNGVVAASSLTLGVVAGIVAWTTLMGPETATAGEVIRLESSNKEASTLAAEKVLLLQRIQELERQNEQLMTMRENAPKQPAEPSVVEPDVIATPEVATGAVFNDPRFSDALAKVDWQALGMTSKDMQPMLAELVKQMGENGEVPTELAVKIQQLNSKLLAELPKMMESGLPGTGMNGVYTHPLIAANSMASTLAAAGQPLDAAQQSAVAGLVRAFSSENDSIEATQNEFAAESVLQELEMKDRFYKEVATRLTPEQFASLYPEGSTENDGANLFGTGLMASTLAHPVPAKSPAEFARRTSRRIAEGLDLDDATAAKVRTIINSMSSQASELWRYKSTVNERKLRMLRTGRTITALRHQVAMWREIARQVQLTPEQRRKFVSMKKVFVPLPQ